MKSILFLLRSFSLGGAERQLCVLAAGLKQSGYSVKIAVFYAGGPLEAEAREMGIEIMDLKRMGRWDLFPFFLRLVNLVKREKPDILHSYLQVPNIWSSFVKLVLPRTKVVWGIRASNMAMENYGWQWQLTDNVEALLAKIPDWIVCNSQAGLLYHAQKGYPTKKMSVIPNGINTKRFFPDRKLGESLRKQWGVQDYQKLIGMAARIDPMKDYPNFLHAAALLIQERKDIRFVCIGDGPDKLVREYRELSHSLALEHFLIWTGKLEDMLAVYNATDILVLSSAYGEGFSNALGEAMACGVPCVATDVGDTARLIGSLGEVVPPKDSAELKRGISTLLNRLGNETDLNSEIVQRIVDQYSVAKLISTTVETLEEVLAAKSGAKSP